MSKRWSGITGKRKNKSSLSSTFVQLIKAGQQIHRFMMIVIHGNNPFP